MDWEVLLNDAEVTRPATAEEAVATLLSGNSKYSHPDPDLLPPSADVNELVKQAPMCIILGCADARVPAELVFNTGSNRLFVVRVAGNVLGDECLGSIEYALAHFPDTVRLVLVMGHGACGAVAAAVSAYLGPRKHVDLVSSRSLRAVVNHISVAVRSAALMLEHAYGEDVCTKPGFEAALTELAVPVNAALTSFQLWRELQPPADAPYRVAFSHFDIRTGVVGVPDLSGPAIHPAPTTADDLIRIGREVAAGPAVRRHLEPA